MENKKPTCVSALSGGVDTTTMVYSLVAEGKVPYCVYMDYGANFREKEIACVKSICKKLNLQYKIIDARWYKDISNCQMFGDDVEIEKGAMHWLEGRNCIITLVLGVIAAELNVKDIYMGVHKPLEGWDAELYLDALPETYEALNKIFNVGFKKDLKVITPFIDEDQDKADIVAMGEVLDVDWMNTTTCCTSNEACWKCEACDDRIKSFDKVEVVDPTRDYVKIPKV